MAESLPFHTAKIRDQGGGRGTRGLCHAHAGAANERKIRMVGRLSNELHAFHADPDLWLLRFADLPAAKNPDRAALDAVNAVSSNK